VPAPVDLLPRRPDALLGLEDSGARLRDALLGAGFEASLRVGHRHAMMTPAYTGG
jgi:hypothetical protein